MSSQQHPSGRSVSGFLGRLGSGRVIGIAVALVAIAGVVMLWAGLSHRNTPSTVAGRAGESPTAASVPATGAAGSSAASPIATSTTQSGNAGSGGSSGRPNSSTAKVPSAKKQSATQPTKAELQRLRPDEWLLYGSQTISAGTAGKSNGVSTVDGVALECQAQALVDGRPVHAIFDCRYSAQNPASSGGAGWSIFGTWSLTPDQPSTISKHYVVGVSGALSGTSSGRPPAAGDIVAAGIQPIGAYRAQGAITEGSFKGNSVFEGVLALPSVGAPPPSK